MAFSLAILKFDWSEHLVLGTRGLAGFAWSMISIAGSFWAIRACLAAATPGWLRELAGIRSHVTDCVVGMDLELELKVCRRLRANMGNALGISSENKDGVRCFWLMKQTYLYLHIFQIHNPSSWKDIYVFDSSTSSFVRAVSDQEAGEANIRFCPPRHHSPKQMDSFQQTMLLASAVCKTAEVFVLCFMGAGLVSLTTALPWGVFVLGGLYLSYRADSNAPTRDIIAGRLPTSVSAGGPFKVVLNVQNPVKSSLSWQVFWTLGGTISTISYALTLYFLSFHQTQTIICWFAFRLVDYYGCSFVHNEGDSSQPPPPLEFSSYTLQSLPPDLKPRIFDLILATSRYQSLVHVRGTQSYEDDHFSSQQVISMITLPTLTQQYPAYELLNQGHTSFTVDIVGIIGDTLLSSAAWIMGSEWTPTDLYDCCIVSFRNSKSSANPLINVPCARVLSSPFKPKVDDHIPQIVPKGTPNSGVGIEWIYFIPLNHKTFLVLQRPPQLSCKGVHRGQVMSHEEVTDMLSKGTLNISMTHVDQVKETIALSQLAYHKLLSIGVKS